MNVAKLSRLVFALLLVSVGSMWIYFLPRLQIKIIRRTNSDGFSLEHEEGRRRVQRGEEELWAFLSESLHRLRNPNLRGKQIVQAVDAFISEGSDMHWKLRRDFEKLATVDKAEEWRKRELTILGDLVQKKLYKLQNPSDCVRALKLRTKWRNVGFGSQLHTFAFALQVALRTGRTLVVDFKDWNYAPEGGWETAFLPISDTCRDPSGASVGQWGNLTEMERYQVVDMSVHPTYLPEFTPYALPSLLAERVRRVHADPALWWAGQLVKFLLRPNAALQQYVSGLKSRLHFATPLVGLQIRRTDKLKREARFYNLSDFMNNAETFFRFQEASGRHSKRRVYIATDDPTAVAEARKTFPHYEVFHNEEASKSSIIPRQRYNPKNLFGTVADLFLLAESDYIVGTMTSNMGRAAFELMQTGSRDLSDRMTSLDVAWVMHAYPRQYQAVLPEKRPGRLNFEVGDIVELYKNAYRHATVTGRLLGTTERKWLSFYKIRMVFPTYDSPFFQEGDFA